MKVFEEEIRRKCYNNPERQMEKRLWLVKSIMA
jgi:hypothetical protein